MNQSAVGSRGSTGESRKRALKLKGAAVGVLGLLAGSFGSANSSQPPIWPHLRNVSKEVEIDFRAPRTMVDVRLLDVDGKPVYRLICFSGTDEAVDGAGGFIYSGGLLCGLGDQGIRLQALLEGGTLLDEKESAIFSRGAFNPEEIVGACASYPDFGVVRIFRLRGFRLELRLEDVEVEPGYEGGSEFRLSEEILTNETRAHFPIGHAKLTIEVTQDPTAKNERASPSRYTDPKGDQQMCRAPQKK